ncbi:MAG: DUF1080 domain-containing protein [Bryobacteraceae bacterium]|nr:DUF1080 domain-containing protein [Bryobacteraceae bacterium]
MRLLPYLCFASLLCAQDAITFGKANGQPLAWKTVGDGRWHLMRDGTLVGQRDLIGQGPRKSYDPDPKAFRAWLDRQAWLYTDAEYGDFTLDVDYWLRDGGNSGISLRDPSRAAAGVQAHPDFSKTPSKVAYEIQLNNRYPDPEISGAIYRIQPAKPGVHRDNEWNHIRIVCRNEQITVSINGTEVAKHATDPARPKRGPIGLQLHDQFSVTMFRNFKLTAAK